MPLELPADAVYEKTDYLQNRDAWGVEMIVKSFIVEHLGPFSAPTKIVLDSEVTIFTGANDAGKSCALNALEMISKRRKAAESEINKDRFGQHAGPWDSDPAVRIAAELEVSSSSVNDRLLAGSLRAGDIIRCQYQPNVPEAGYKIHKINRGLNAVPVQSAQLLEFPRVVKLRPDAEIRGRMELGNLNAAEDQLLKLAFGKNFDISSFVSLGIESRSRRLDMARESLNHRLREFFPSTLPFEFRLFEVGTDAQAIGVSLVDEVRGYTEVGLRGTGIRRLLSLMTMLLQEVDSSRHTLILLDEPETSLHADAQHKLRKTLENLGARPKLQVIYATHSPSMINPAHPERLRVFSRGTNGELATSAVATPAYGENFQQVRISLGLNPSDSLLYGLVSILVEGDTEVRCLAELLRRLDEEGVAEFHAISKQLEVCHFVSCQGDSISYYCKLASDQNAEPVVFLDGDKKTTARRIREERPGVPVVELPEGTEFEDLIPPDRYITALASELRKYFDEEVVASISPKEFENWARRAEVPERMMFSKKIERWILERTATSYNKHAVMSAAIADTPVGEINFAAIIPLVNAIREKLK